MGAHCSAKTTRIEFLDQISQLMDYNLYIVPEAARLCPYDINKEAGFKSQMWMVETQIRMEQEAEKWADSCTSKYEPLIVCDRSLYDMMVYSKSLYCNNKMTKEEYYDIEYRVRDAFDNNEVLSYDKVYLCTPRPIIDDGVRDTDRGWQLELYNIFKYIVGKYNLPVVNLR